MLEHERLKQNDLLSTIKRNAISVNKVTVLIRNVRSHVDDIVGDKRIINNGIIGFTETQIKLSDFSIK